ncbi:MAG: hypothetical protein HYZ58_01260, partial [Acidobacteria bacterium]|nr:hypothetical protein [Acidobacteriota bacterium]
MNSSTRAGFTYFRGDKLKFGRGASATRLDETTWNQTGPTSIYKGEVNLARSNLFLTGRVAYADMGFSLTPRGGLDKSVFIDDAGVVHNSYLFYSTKRPQKTGNVEGNFFKGKHELKFGYAYRKFPVDSITQWPGTKIETYHIGYPDLYAVIKRDHPSKTEGEYHNLYVGDTITFDRATLNVGVRWDYQTSSLLPISVQGVKGAPEVERLLPSLNAPGVDKALKYNTLTPRVGFSYALDDSRKTLLRASYSQFASQLGAADAGFVGVVNYSYLYYLAVDRNGNGTAEFNEILFNLGLDGYYGVD